MHQFRIADIRVEQYFQFTAEFLCCNSLKPNSSPKMFDFPSQPSIPVSEGWGAEQRAATDSHQLSAQESVRNELSAIFDRSVLSVRAGGGPMLHSPECGKKIPYNHFKLSTQRPKIGWFSRNWLSFGPCVQPASLERSCFKTSMQSVLAANDQCILEGRNLCFMLFSLFSSHFPMSSGQSHDASSSSG